MNRAELVNAVVEKTALKKKEVDAAVGVICDVITAALARGEKVQLVGFGSFEVRQRAARTGRNPRTGEEISVPAARVPVFRPGASLKEAVGRQ
ncbi:MAG: HU family DNA-binding protein [Moorella sp. (in: Bacteria)]|nr:HU family DNA-binding protein [Moorella sp. (in: firmicutes)]